MENWKNDPIGSCVRGENPTLIARMKSGFCVMGYHQFLPGYCLLLGYPVAGSLNELSLPERSQYLIDMSLIGDAIIKACNPLRINYSTLMNTEHFLHTHIEARYAWEPEEFRRGPSYVYPKEMRLQPQYEFSEERHGDLKGRIAENLLALMGEAYS